ncbi:serine/threonine-protein kinase VRK3 isoform X2 [Tamandua tetradactyla]|uniref:serine/threonine-protein kinase VRK3 isoform X2 n=1 Tax=Tamandua tetradactyla TaxID=48850 RepID=UPI0040542396
MVAFCPNCGKSLKAAFKFCPYCGKPLPTQEHEESPTSVEPFASSFQGSKRDLSSSSEKFSKKVKWSSSITSLSSFSDGDNSGSEDALSSSVRPKGSWNSPPTPKGSPQAARPSPQTRKRSRVTATLEALPTGTVLKDKSEQHWKLKSLQTRDDQGILYEEKITMAAVLVLITTVEPALASACKSSPQKQRFSLKLDAKDGRLFNEQNFFQRAAKPLQVNKWKKLYSTPLLAIPTCVGFGIHQDKYRFLVLPMLGRSLQSALDENPKHVMSERCVFQVACRLLDALEFLHENEYVHGNVTAENIFVNPEDLTQVPGQPRVPPETMQWPSQVLSSLAQHFGLGFAGRLFCRLSLLKRHRGAQPAQMAYVALALLPGGGAGWSLTGLGGLSILQSGLGFCAWCSQGGFPRGQEWKPQGPLRTRLGKPRAALLPHPGVKTRHTVSRAGKWIPPPKGVSRKSHHKGQSCKGGRSCRTTSHPPLYLQCCTVAHACTRAHVELVSALALTKVGSPCLRFI